MTGRTTPRKQGKNALEERILKLAREKFFVLGFSAVTMDEIAAELGISKKTLYKLFPEKKVLLERVLSGFIAETKELLDETANQPGLSTPQRLHALLGFIVTRLGEVKFPFVRDMQRHAYDVFLKIETFREKMLSDLFSNLYRQGVRQGVIRKDISETIMLEVLLALVNNIANPDKLTKLQILPAAAIQTICSIVFEGILNEKGRKLYANK